MVQLRSKDKFKIDLGLDRVKKVLALFDNPQDKVKYIHIAGTNGKGSVCAILEAILIQDKRKKIGKYTSPHLFNYTERFSIDGVNIKEDEFNSLVERVDSVANSNGINLTEFEILTVVCFIYFAKNNVDIGILETGLGGRLDATNVVVPICSVITSISYDHKEILGDTIEKISYEKAGILKKGVKCVFLKENRGYETLLKEAQKKGAILINDNIELSVENGFATINNKKIPFNLRGDFQKENLKLALLALDALEYKIPFKTIEDALKKVRWKFRMEELNKDNQKVLVDSCHNPDGARVLDEYINKYHKREKIKFIYGTLSNKDYKSVLDILYKKEYDFCFYEFDYPNSLKYEGLGEYKNKLRKITNPVSEIKKGGFDLVILCGSIYMLGEIFSNTCK